jgi:hypothetical protein
LEYAPLSFTLLSCHCHSLSGVALKDSLDIGQKLSKIEKHPSEASTTVLLVA